MMTRKVKGGMQGEKRVQGDQKATCQERKCVDGSEKYTLRVPTQRLKERSLLLWYTQSWYPKVISHSLVKVESPPWVNSNAQKVRILCHLFLEPLFFPPTPRDSTKRCLCNERLQIAYPVSKRTCRWVVSAVFLCINNQGPRQKDSGIHQGISSFTGNITCEWPSIATLQLASTVPWCTNRGQLRQEFIPSVKNAAYQWHVNRSYNCISQLIITWDNRRWYLSYHGLRARKNHGFLKQYLC